MIRPTRRAFLAGVTATTTAVAGCTSGPGVTVERDPYGDLDWGAVEHHKSQFHNHVRGDVSTAAEVADLYHERGYTVYGVLDKGRRPVAWPWTEFSAVADTPGDEEDRDPAEMGVVAFPGCEFNLGPHVNALFTTIDHSPESSLSFGIEGEHTIGEQIEMILGNEASFVPPGDGGLAVISHPARYYEFDDLEAGFEQNVSLYEEWTLEDGLIGMEVFNKDSRYNLDLDLWDALLTELAPDRMIWGFGADDPNFYSDYGGNRDFDLRWTTVLLEDDEFDPGEQTASRRAAADAFRYGRTLFHQRDPWPADEDPPAVPRVESIDVDENDGAIRIEATHYDDIEWVSSGEVIAEGPEVALSSESTPYVRAHLSTAATETSTQPIGIGEA